jgi:hypothetical protein
MNLKISEFRRVVKIRWRDLRTGENPCNRMRETL